VVNWRALSVLSSDPKADRPLSLGSPSLSRTHGWLPVLDRRKLTSFQWNLLRAQLC
jgi:hypothetical protein